MKKFLLVIGLMALFCGVAKMAKAEKVSDVYAVYTCEYPGTTQYDPRVCGNTANVCVWFKVVEECKVKVTWKIVGLDGKIKYYEIVENDEALEPGLHGECFHPEVLAPGTYKVTATVKPLGGKSKKSGECVFDVAGSAGNQDLIENTAAIEDGLYGKLVTTHIYGTVFMCDYVNSAWSNCKPATARIEFWNKERTFRESYYYTDAAGNYNINVWYKPEYDIKVISTHTGKFRWYDNYQLPYPDGRIDFKIKR